MDYGNILARAWNITWRWKVLWILGFLASLGGGWSSWSGSNYRVQGGDWGPAGVRVPEEMWALIAAVGCLGLLLGVALWVVGTIARGGLISGVQQVEDENATSFGAAWRAGVGRFWTLFGISILTGLPALILFIGGLLILGLLIFGTVAAIDAAAEVGGVVGGTAAFLWGGFLCCGGILLVVVLEQIRIYAERAAMLEGLDWIGSFKRGWEVLKKNLGPTVVLWLIFLVIGFLAAALVAGPIIALVMPVAATTGARGGSWNWLIVPLCVGGLLWAIFMAVLSSVVETFTSATWTLAYRQFTGGELPPSEAASEATALE